MDSLIITKLVIILSLLIAVGAAAMFILFILQDKFKTLKRDCRIVCHQFEIPGWEPEVRVQVEGKSYVAAVFKYEIPDFQPLRNLPVL
jgi:hypothetical protein